MTRGPRGASARAAPFPRGVAHAASRRGAVGGKRKESGPNLNGSWQQGHSAAYDTRFCPSRQHGVSRPSARPSHECAKPWRGNERQRDCRAEAGEGRMAPFPARLPT